MERRYAPSVADERTMLSSFLDFHRATLEMKCEGLSPEQLKLRAVEPSPLTLLGLVRHMAEVERSWFQRTFLGEDAPRTWYTPEDRDAVFRVQDADVAEAFEHFDAACERSRQIVSQADLLEAIAARQLWDDPISLRWILNHMIEEYARHNGHADLLRERIDGTTGD